jgi:protein-S-isoprenylcysteine O-methyltransferase Ste14
LLLNSWLVLTTCIVGFILMKVYISNEYHILEEAFGDEYLKYKAETPEFFPFPVKKWFHRKS